MPTIGHVAADPLFVQAAVASNRGESLGTPLLDRLSRDLGTAVTIKASGAESADTTGADVTDASLEQATAIAFVLDITLRSGTTPTIDVAIQAAIGSQYFNLVRFSQTGDTTGTKLLIVHRDVSFTTELAPAADPAVGTGVLNNSGAPWGSTFRYKSDLGGTTPSYTYSVLAYPIY